MGVSTLKQSMSPWIITSETRTVEIFGVVPAHRLGTDLEQRAGAWAKVAVDDPGVPKQHGERPVGAEGQVHRPSQARGERLDLSPDDRGRGP